MAWWVRISIASDTDQSPIKVMRRLDLPHVSDLHFGKGGDVREQATLRCGGVGDGELFEVSNQIYARSSDRDDSFYGQAGRNSIRIHMSPRDVAAPLAEAISPS